MSSRAAQKQPFRLIISLFFIGMIMFGSARAQLILTNGAPSASINFANTMQTSVGSNPASAILGNGFEPNTVTNGRLNSNAWAFTGLSDGPLAYGGTRTIGDYARGAVAAAVTTGGIYAYRGAPASVANPTLMFQPAGSDFTPGTITLRILNSGTTIINQLALSYNIFVRNDQGYASSFNFSWSTDDNNYTDVPALNYSSIEVADGLGWVQVGTSPSRSTTLTGINVPPTTYIYLRWTIADVSGSGSRDELGLDDINVTATYTAPCIPPVTQATVSSFANVGPYQMDVNFTRGNGTGGVLIVASTSATLSQQPVSGISYAANTNYGNGDPLGGGFVVYRAAAAGAGNPSTITVTGLSPSTTYYFHVFEYNITVPCYLTPGNSGNRTTGAGSSTLPTDYFRSRASGNWNNTSTWESSSDNITWNPATAKPTGSSSGIAIRTGHTVTITAPETARLLNINAGGTLTYANQAAGGYDLDIVDGPGDDLLISGTLELYGISPGVVAPVTVRVFSGGLVRVNNNVGGNNADDFAYGTQFFANTGAVYEWNTTATFQAAGRTYFVNAASTDVAVFRVTQTTTFDIGGATPTVFNGRFEANANLNFTGTAIKTFRNGIIGTGTINQLAGSGEFQITSTYNNNANQLGGTGAINLTTGLRVVPGAFLFLVSNKTVNGSNFINEGTLYLQQDFVISGSTAFNSAANSTLVIQSTGGISTGASGNVQTGTRTFNANMTYLYNRNINQVTGSALPTTITGTLQIQNGGAGTTTTLTNTNTTVTTLRLVSGLFSVGVGQVLNIAPNGNVWGQGGNQSQIAGEGFINFTGAGTSNPSTAGHYLHNVSINNSIDFVGATANRTSITGTLEIRNGGFVSPGKAPFYSSSPASTLLYNCSCNYGAFEEWYPNTYGTDPGVPHHVTIASNSSLNFGTSNTPHEMRGDLTISSTSTFALSTVGGGDLYIKGNWNKTSGGVFTNNTRLVKFNGSSGTQIIRITGAGTETFAYLEIDKPNGQAVQISNTVGNLTNVNVNGGLGSNSLRLTSGDLDLNGRSMNIRSFISGQQNNIGIDGTAGNLTRNVISSAGTGTLFIFGNGGPSRTLSINRMSANASLLVLSPNVTMTLQGDAPGGNGVNFGPNYTTINGTLQINSFGFVTGNAPTYGTGSFLVYNVNGTFDRNVEWCCTSGAGYPYHVTVQNNTYLQLNTPSINGDADRAIAGNLRIVNGSTLLLSTTANNTLTVGQNLQLEGNLILPTVPNGDIYIGQNWTRTATGVFTHNDRAVFFNTSQNSLITANNGQYFPYLYITKNSLSNTVSLADSIAIGKEMSVITGTFDPVNRNATLLSDATGTAGFGQMGLQADVAYSGTGRFIVERYIPTGTGPGQHAKSWQFLAVPTNDGQTVKQAWQEGAAVANGNPKPGYGTMITANTPSALALGFDAATTLASGPGMKTYNPATNGWTGIASTSIPIHNPKGYMIFVRGDRSVTGFTGPTSVPVPTNLRTRGKLFVPGSNPAPVTNIPAGSFESIGNPYASAIDFLNINKPSAPAVDDVFYVWDPLLPGANNLNLGGYQTISASNGYIPNPGGTANYSNASAYTKIQSGQAFLMHATGAGGNVSFSEASKIAGSQMVYRSTARISPSPGRHFLRIQLGNMALGGRVSDAAVVAFDHGFSNEYEHHDALKLENGGENLGLRNGDQWLAIEARRPVQRRDTVFLQSSNLRRQAYQFRFGPENMPAGLQAFLTDRYLGTTVPISMQDSTYYDFLVNNEPASANTDRFYIVFHRNGRQPQAWPLAETGKKSSSQAPVSEGSVTVYPNPVTDHRLGIQFSGKLPGMYKVQLFNASGSIVHDQALPLRQTEEYRVIQLPPSNASGIYQLQLTGPSGEQHLVRVLLN